MPIYEVTLSGTLFGQSVVNRWDYVSGGVPAAVQGSFGLAFAFGLAPVGAASEPFKVIKDAVSTSMTFTSFVVKNLYDPEDFYSTPFGSTQTGAQPGENLPTFAAYGFRTNQVRTDIARGTKRFGGVPEADNVNGTVAPATLSGLLQPVATAMSAVLTYTDEGNIVSYSPCVLSRQEYVTPAGKRAYRLYPTEAEQLDRAAIGVIWEPYVDVRSQTSRQRGRGR